MSRLPIVMIGLAVVWPLACTSPAPPNNAATQAQGGVPSNASANGSSGATAEESLQAKASVDVEIIVGPRNDLAKRCAEGGLHPTTILVNRQLKGDVKDKAQGHEVFHCVDGKFIPHAEHGKNHLLEKAVVRLSSGQTVRWFSKNAKFFVTSVERPPQDLKNSAPASPFAGKLTTTYANQVTSPPVVDVPNVNIQQLYKVSFDIQEVGLVDPDLVCSM